MDNMPPYLPQVKAGKIRALAVSPAKRSPAAPDLPTVAEAGVPGYASGSWCGLVTRAQTPKAITNKLAAETARRRPKRRRMNFTNIGIEAEH